MGHAKIGVIKGMAVMTPDGLSSVAYATDQMELILMSLIGAGSVKVLTLIMIINLRNTTESANVFVPFTYIHRPHPSPRGDRGRESHHASGLDTHAIGCWNARCARDGAISFPENVFQRL